MGIASAPSERYLDWHAVAEAFRCSRYKALLIMHEVGPVRVGSRVYIRASDLEDKLAADGEIAIKWPR